MPQPLTSKKLKSKVLWRPTRPSRTNSKKRCSLHHRGLECKIRKSEIPGVTGKFGPGVQHKAGQRLIEFWHENTLVIANTLLQQHERQLYTWTSPDGQYGDQIDYTFCSQRWRECQCFSIFIQSAKQDQALTMAQIMNSLLSNSDLNQRKQGKSLSHSGIPKSNPLKWYGGSDKHIQRISSDGGRTMEWGLWH